MLPDALGPLPILLGALVLAWNVTLAGWMGTRREGPRWFANLSSLIGLLVAPAAVLAVAASTDAGARTITGVTWLWPATCLLFVLQAASATALRYVSSSVGLPLLAYNLLLAAIAVGDDLVARSGSAPLLLQGAVAARDSVLGIVMGRAALATPLAVLVPLLAPAYPARWRASALVRALLVLYAVIAGTLLAMEWPRGVAVIRSFDGASTFVEPREPSRFPVGVRLLPPLDGPPSPRAVRASARLAERVSPDAVMLVLRLPAGPLVGLDSVAQVLAPYRAAGARVLLALSFERDDALAVRAAPAATSARRLATLRSVVARVRPDVVWPALPPAAPALRAGPTPSVLWWQSHLTAAAAEVRRAHPTARVAWAVSRFDAVDSALHAWAMRPDSPLDAAGFVLAPGFSGLPALDARLRAADRWVSAHDGAARPHWILTHAFPRAHGDTAQAQAILHVYAWASRREWSAGLIVGEPTDDAGMLGLVAADRRERAVLERLRRGR
jgi:hypothetical protein